MARMQIALLPPQDIASMHMHDELPFVATGEFIKSFHASSIAFNGSGPGSMYFQIGSNRWPAKDKHFGLVVGLQASQCSPACKRKCPSLSFASIA